MDIVILQNILDVFQTDGRGTLVTGKIGAAWNSARRGDRILLRTPEGRTIRTAIKDLELFAREELTSEALPSCGILLADVFSSEQLPAGTNILKVADEHTA